MFRRAASGAARALQGLRARLHATPRGRRWAAVAAWMALIFVMSAQPQSGEQSGALLRMIAAVLRLEPTPEQAMHWHHLLRKGAHFTEYGVLASLTAWALPAGRCRWLAAWAIATGYAATDELHQALVPNRGPAVTDVAIDSAGAATAIGSLLLLRRLLRPAPGPDAPVP